MQQIEGTSYFSRKGRYDVEYTRYSPLLSYPEYLSRSFQNHCIDLIFEISAASIAGAALLSALRVRNLGTSLAVFILENIPEKVAICSFYSFFRENSFFTENKITELENPVNYYLTNLLSRKLTEIFSIEAYRSNFPFLRSYLPENFSMETGVKISKDYIVFVGLSLDIMIPFLLRRFVSYFWDLFYQFKIDCSKKDERTPEHCELMQKFGELTSHPPSTQLFKKLGWIREGSVTRTEELVSSRFTAIYTNQTKTYISTFRVLNEFKDDLDTYLQTYRDLQNLGVLTIRIAGVFRIFQESNFSKFAENIQFIFKYFLRKEIENPLIAMEIPENYIKESGASAESEMENFTTTLAEAGLNNDSLVKQLASIAAALDYLKIPVDSLMPIYYAFIVSNDQSEMRLQKLDFYDSKASFTKPLKDNINFNHDPKLQKLFDEVYNEKMKELNQYAWMYIGIDPYVAFKEIVFYTVKSFTIIATRAQTLGHYFSNFLLAPNLPQPSSP
jgi:hypothetical protein